MPSKYVTKKGDTWDLIAFKTLGSEYYMDKLMKVNLEYIDTVVFDSGITLDIPQIEETVEDNIPIWKR